MIKIIIGVVVAAFVVIGGFLLLDPNIKNNNGDITELETKNTYTIEGEVSKPGTYSLKDEITMGDLIDAAGGITTNGDELAYFENAVIKSGVTYYIAGKFDATDICNDKEIVKVNVNSADVTELKTINGITSTVAESIVSYRNDNGTYTYLEQLLDVYGIGNATYRKIRNYLILHE